jgi:hypothetical protein
MITIHHVIPHPGFLRDAGSPEQALHIQGEFYPSSPLTPDREPASGFAGNHLQVLMIIDDCCRFLLATRADGFHEVDFP